MLYYYARRSLPHTLVAHREDLRAMALDAAIVLPISATSWFQLEYGSRAAAVSGNRFPMKKPLSRNFSAPN